MKRGNASFGTIMSVFGAILIACGIAWLIAQNWNQFSGTVKILIMVILTGSAYTAGVVLKEKAYPKTGRTLLILGALLYTLSIFLIAQVFSVDISLQGNTWLLLLAIVGVLASAYLFEEPYTLLIGLLELLIWIVMQYASIAEKTNEFSAGMLALAFLAVGVLFWGLDLWHRATHHGFAKVYRMFTVFYVLIFAYILSFQMLLPSLWAENVTTSQIMFVSGIALLGIIVAGAGIIKKHSLQTKELTGFIIAMLLILTVIGASFFVQNTVGRCDPMTCYEYNDATSCQSAPDNMQCEWKAEWNSCQEKNCWDKTTEETCLADEKLGCTWEQSKEEGICQPTDPARSNWEALSTHCNQYGNQYEMCSSQETCTWHVGGWLDNDAEVPGNLTVAWIWANLVLLALILGVIFYGTWSRESALINIGIGFFGLTILTRYLGFVVDLWGYTSLAIIFISGGIVLIFGGWGVEKWRRNLIASVKAPSVRSPRARKKKQ